MTKGEPQDRPITLHVTDRSGRILCCVHSTQYSHLVLNMQAYVAGRHSRRYGFSVKRAGGRAVSVKADICRLLSANWRKMAHCRLRGVLPVRFYPAGPAVWHHIRRLVLRWQSENVDAPPSQSQGVRCPFTCARRVTRRVRFHSEPVLISATGKLPGNRLSVKRHFRPPPAISVTARVPSCLFSVGLIYPGGR